MNKSLHEYHKMLKLVQGDVTFHRVGVKTLKNITVEIKIALLNYP
jgi:hypothetical protein